MTDDRSEINIHSTCNRLMTDMSIKELDGIISLPYFKQGTDFASSAVYSDEDKKVIDVLKSLNNHGEMLRHAIDILQQINDILKRHKLKDGEINIGGDTHIIWISGPANIMRELVKQKLVDLYPPD